MICIGLWDDGIDFRFERASEENRMKRKPVFGTHPSPVGKAVRSYSPAYQSKGRLSSSMIYNIETWAVSCLWVMFLNRIQERSESIFEQVQYIGKRQKKRLRGKRPGCLC
mmetsp:Transcript_13745/g.31978  ORF Transcript_13745/g.31978 Transcript_13745/m.31978 type:complete len:110 (+) Transcript_13745:1192-1521(+)